MEGSYATSRQQSRPVKKSKHKCTHYYIQDAKYLAMRNGMELHEVSVKDNLQQLI